MALERDAGERLPAVLLVDDDGEFLAFMREELERLTRRVYVARSALEALWVLHDLDIDAVVCDLVLGASDGLHLLEQVQAERPDLARVLLTGFGAIAARHPALDVAHTVLHKPTDAASLVEVLRWIPSSALMMVPRTGPRLPEVPPEQFGRPKQLSPDGAPASYFPAGGDATTSSESLESGK